MTEREANGVVEKAKKLGDAWVAIIGGLGATVTLGTQLLPLVQKLSDALRWGAGLAGTIGLIAVLFYTHRRRRAAERERDEARAELTKIPSKEHLAARWPLERALLVDLMSNDTDHAAVEIQSNRTDIKAHIRLTNQAPFPIRTVKLALKWTLTDTEGGVLLRGAKEVIEAFGALEPGGRERHVVELTAEVMKTGTQALPVARLAIVGDIVACSDIWDGNAKSNLGSFTWVVVVDRVVERLVDDYDGILAAERRKRR